MIKQEQNEIPNVNNAEKTFKIYLKASQRPNSVQATAQRPNPVEATARRPNPQQATILIKQEQNEIPNVNDAFALSTSKHEQDGNPDIKPFEFKCKLCNAQFKCLNVYAAIAKSHYSLHIRSKHPFHSLLVKSYLNEIEIPVVKCSKCGMKLRNSGAHQCSKRDDSADVLETFGENSNAGPKFITECPKCSAFVEEANMVEHSRLAHIKMDQNIAISDPNVWKSCLIINLKYYSY